MNNTITAEILDTATTPGQLAIDLENTTIAVEVTDNMEDTAEAIPALVEALEKAGYRFAGEPTDIAGEVELVRI